MAIYTKEKIAEYVKIIRKYIGRVASYEDWSELLEVSIEELDGILQQGMSPEEVEEFNRITQEVGNAQADSKNLVSMYYPTNDTLGKRTFKSGTIGKFIDPLNTDVVLAAGQFRPRPYDILYVVCQSEDENITMKKFLVEGVLVKGQRIFVEAIKIKEEAVGKKFDQNGVEKYILSLF